MPGNGNCTSCSNNGTTVMSQYLNHHAGALFDEFPDMLNTVSETAQDIERLYNRFSGSDTDADSITSPNPSAGMPYLITQTPEQGAQQATPATDYTPYIIGAGVVAVAAVTIWLVTKK